MAVLSKEEEEEEENQQVEATIKSNNNIDAANDNNKLKSNCTIPLSTTMKKKETPAAKSNIEEKNPKENSYPPPKKTSEVSIQDETSNKKKEEEPSSSCLLDASTIFTKKSKMEKQQESESMDKKNCEEKKNRSTDDGTTMNDEKFGNPSNNNNKSQECNTTSKQVESIQQAESTTTTTSSSAPDASNNNNDNNNHEDNTNCEEDTTNNDEKAKWSSSSSSSSSSCSSSSSMELNVAYEAFETMRKLNLELECQEAGIVFTEKDPIDHTVCTRCLVEHGPPVVVVSNQPETNTATTTTTTTTTTAKNKNKPLRWLQKVGNDSKKFLDASQKSLKEKTLKKSQPPCLLCGSPTCPNHASKAFRKEKITLCLICVESLEYDFGSCSDDTQTLRLRVEHLVDLYDRAVLLLRYCQPFLLDTASRLETTTKHSNTVGVGSSSAGLVSGALGVAAACTILTPAGPPLLIASLVFGGSATAVNAGSGLALEFFFSEPHRLANRILALRGIVVTILQQLQSMRETTLLPYLNQAMIALSSGDSTANNINEKQPLDATKVETAVSNGVLVGSTASVGVTLGLVAAEEGGVVASRFVTRATTTGLARSSTRMFAQIAGGALSAACIVMEARELSKTISQIRRGNPCETATTLRTLHDRLQYNNDGLPPTPSVDAMCQSYIKVKTKQINARRLLQEQSKLQDDDDDDDDTNNHENDLALVEEVVSSLEAQSVITPKDVSKTVIGRPKKLMSKSALLERVQRYKQKQEEANREEVATVNLIV